MKHRLLLFCVGLCFLFAGCKENGDKSVLPDTLTIATDEVSDFCPYNGESFGKNRILSLIYEPLYAYDENLLCKPVLAESCYKNDGENSVTVNLKKDAFWHNGAGFSADDVLYTIAVMKENGYDSGISFIEKTGEYSVKITFEKPFLQSALCVVISAISGVLFSSLK